MLSLGLRSLRARIEERYYRLCNYWKFFPALSQDCCRYFCQIPQQKYSLITLSRTTNPSKKPSYRMFKKKGKKKRQKWNKLSTVYSNTLQFKVWCFSSKGIVPVHPDRVTFNLKTIDDENEVNSDNELMKQMCQQFVQDMKTLCSGNCLPASKTELAISVSTSSSYSNLTYDTDESYYLRVKTDGESFLSIQW